MGNLAFEIYGSLCVASLSYWQPILTERNFAPEFPELEDEDIQQALIYVSTYLDDRIIELPTSYETVA